MSSSRPWLPAFALALPLLACRGPLPLPSSEEESAELGPSTGPSETETSTDSGDPPDTYTCEPWDDALPAPLGMGPTIPTTFVDASTALGPVDTAYFPDTWAPGCDPEGEGVIGTPCKMELQGGGVAIGDFDDDGWPDIYLTRLARRDLLLRNTLGEGGGLDGLPAFEEVGLARGLVEEFGGNGAAWVDVDGDTDLDLYVTAIDIPGRFWFYRNELVESGEARFTEAAADHGLALDDGLPHFGFGIGVGDYDRDGWIDLHTSEWWPGGNPAEHGHHVRLLHNLGALGPGIFEDQTEAAGASMLMINPEGVYAFAPTFVDLDEDGWLDLAVTSDNGTSRLFWNRHDGTFRDGTPGADVSIERNGMGSTFGDYDGDGHIDWYVSAIFSPSNEVDCGNPVCGTGGNRLYRSKGPYCFEELALEHGVHDGGWGWGAAFWDPDNDGDLDLVEVNGFSTPHGPPGPAFVGDPLKLWRNDSQSLGAAGFVEVAADTGLVELGQGRALVPLDYDRDGDQDLLVVDNGGPFGTHTKLWRNETGDQNAWLSVELAGPEGNRAGIGARVELQRDAAGPRQVRVIGVGAHFLAHGEYRAHFGLGPSEAPVAELRVMWPDGEQSVLTGVSARQQLTIPAP